MKNTDEFVESILQEMEDCKAGLLAAVVTVLLVYQVCIAVVS